MNKAALIVPGLALLLSACGSGGAPTKVKSVSAKPVPVAAITPRPRPVTKSPVGLDGITGATNAELTRQFGTPRLDVWEGSARKLQFTGSACVLDIYLYPSSAGREPQATYVETRRASDGRDVDRNSCIAALRKR